MPAAAGWGRSLPLHFPLLVLDEAPLFQLNNPRSVTVNNIRISQIRFIEPLQPATRIEKIIVRGNQGHINVLE
jgi:hypothetical protein